MTVLQNNTSFMDEKLFTVKEPMSALTHLIGAVCSIFAMPVLLIHASLYHASKLDLIAYMIFMISMILLYSASTIYHSFSISPKVNKALKKIDHMMIFILIAGTYTQVCLIVLGDRTGWGLLALVWGIAIAGIVIKACWIYCPKWFSSLIYIAMGWVCVAVFGQLISSMQSGAFALLLSGGIIYTVGGIIYALKLPLFNSRHTDFGSHEIFHLFVMGGSFCHFVVMYYFVAAMPV